MDMSGLQGNMLETAMGMRHLAETSPDPAVQDGSTRLEKALSEAAFGSTEPLPADDNAVAALQALKAFDNS